DENYSSLSGDTLLYTANYFINVPHNSSEPKSYAGNLQFNMVRDSRSNWSIYFWKDTRSGSLPSWSELKGYWSDAGTFETLYLANKYWAEKKMKHHHE
ncbi:MAG: hypothetical protein QXO70_04595, partial [Candidatus Pacearchaeota archaeon]